jgi:hypothetical protein
MRQYLTKCPKCAAKTQALGPSVYPLQLPLEKCFWCGYQTKDRDRQINPDPRAHANHACAIMEALTTIGEFYEG